MVSIFHHSVSHVTGTVTQAGVALSQKNFPQVVTAISLLGCFFIGCFISGSIIGDSHLKIGRRYGIILILLSILLAISLYSLSKSWKGAEYLIAMACGLQNAMTTTYSGAIIRTTHMTGIVTDLGILLGQWVRYKKTEYWKVGLLSVLLLGFFSGGVAGGWLYQFLSYYCLIIPMVCSGMLGVGYYLYRQLCLTNTK